MLFAQTYLEPEAGGEGMDQCIEFTKPGSAPFDISLAPSPVEPAQIPSGTVVGEIQYSRYPIFNANDPKEDNQLFSLVDWLHIDTKKRILRDQILFAPGDVYEPRVVEESARILREADYLYDARIWPYQLCGNRVDMEVVTREVWTLYAGGSLSRSGGNDKTSLYVTDANFLGRGETLSVEYKSTTDRDGWQLGYIDNSVVGSRHRLELFYADNSDGSQTDVVVERPFYSLNSHNAWGVAYHDVEREDDLFERGEEVATFQTYKQSARAYWGLSNGWVDGKTQRWWLGVNTQLEEYEPLSGDFSASGIPQNREVNYPFISTEKIHESFIKVNNLNQMHRIEDFNLGVTWSALLGVADKSFGSDEDRLVLDLYYRDAWMLSDHTLMQLESSINGFWRYDEDISDEVQVALSWRYYNGVYKKHGTYFAADARYARNLPGSEQILVGSDERLRGYPSRYQEGDRSVVFTAEHRYYTDWHILRIFRVGAAAFLDVGRAWETGDRNDGATGWLSDAGFGLRIASSRAQSKSILHIDIAFPFNRPDDVDRYQVVVEAKTSF
ncbi:BamA/TamA family outer membrane protein [Aurantivibrio plasticivorans]